MTCMLNSFGYFLRETAHSLIHNKFMAIASVLTVTLSMFILGVFLAVVLNMNHMAGYLESQVEMSVYLKDGLTTEQVMGVGQRLKALPDLSDLSLQIRIRLWRNSGNGLVIRQPFWMQSMGIHCPLLTGCPSAVRTLEGGSRAGFPVRGSGIRSVRAGYYRTAL